jgi:metallo-beta-lactamase family protein
MRLTLLGGTGTVTGSKYLLEHEGRRLLVDAGLFQGLKQLRQRNREELAVRPSQIDAIVLTHAHLDHSGFVPKLVQLGFRGRVYCSSATRDLCGLLLPDSGRLLDEEADYANRHGFSRHHPALPLYTEQDALVALECLTPCAFGAAFEPIPGVGVLLRHAGHLLGAASVRVDWDGRSILFSGDLGRSNDLLMQAPEPPEAADWVIVESTYGDRAHERVDPLTAIAEVINRTAARGGVVVIPAFAVGRAQTLLYGLHLLKQQRRIPHLPVFLNSPMAADATQLYIDHRVEHRLTPEQCKAMCKHRAHRQQRGGIKAPERDPRAGGHRLGQRHGVGRPRAASLESLRARLSQQHRVRRLPGRRHARRVDRRGRGDGEDPRPARADSRRGRANRRAVVTWRSR